MVRIIRWLLLLLGLAGLVLTCLPSVSTDTWWIRSIDFTRLQLLIAIAIVWLGLALVARTWLSWTMLVLLAVAAAYNASILFPYSSVPGVMERAAAACPANNRLRLLEVNVQMTNQHDHKLLRMVQQLKPDIAWFQETDDWWAEELSALSQEMPYHVQHPQPNYFGVDLYSRFELVNPEIKFLTGSANPSIFTGVKLPSGQLIRFYAIHPRPPQVGQSTAERDGQLMAAALAARNDQVAHVVAGDMNSTPWEDVIRRALRVGRFLDPRVGRGLYVSWNANSWWMKWPLDQILPGPEFTLSSLQVLPDFGSDHYPYFAELCLDPQEAAQQAAPSLNPEDIALAQQAVARGQGKADKTGDQAAKSGS